MKVLSGRGRKRNRWVEYFHQLFHLEFERFSSPNIKLSRGVLQYLAVLLLNENNSIDMHLMTLILRPGVQSVNTLHLNGLIRF